jgi:hypothetical protein
MPPGGQSQHQSETPSRSRSGTSWTAPLSCNPQAALTFGQFFGSNFHTKRAVHLIPIRYNLRSLTERGVTAGMTAFSVALVAMVLLLLSGFVAGAAHTMAAAANGNNWIVLEKAVSNESGGMTHEMYGIVRALPELQNDAAGGPSSPESLYWVSIQLPMPPSRPMPPYAVLPRWLS